MGDWNAIVGSDNPTAYPLEKYQQGITNNNGVRLIKLALEYNPKSSSLFFKETHSRKWTWTSPNKKVTDEIEHLSINDNKMVPIVKY